MSINHVLVYIQFVFLFNNEKRFSGSEKHLTEKQKENLILPTLLLNVTLCSLKTNLISEKIKTSGCVKWVLNIPVHDLFKLSIEAAHGSLVIFVCDSSSDSIRIYSLVAQSFSDSSWQQIGEPTVAYQPVHYRVFLQNPKYGT